MNTIIKNNYSPTNTFCHQPKDSTTSQFQSHPWSTEGIVSQYSIESIDLARFDTSCFRIFLHVINMKFTEDSFNAKPEKTIDWIQTIQNDILIEQFWYSESEASYRPSWIDESVRKIQQLLKLPENWDSYGAMKINNDVVKYTIDLFLDIFNTPDLYEKLSPPRVVPCPNGSIQLEWEINGRELEIIVPRSLSDPFGYLAIKENESEEGNLEYNDIFDSLFWLIGQNNKIKI